MTKQELEQYRSIVAEIDEVRERLKDNVVSDTVVGSDVQYPYTSHVMRVEGIADKAAAERDKKLLRRLEEQKQSIEEFVSHIPDSQIRRIFRLRYIDGKIRPSWLQIAIRVNHYDESYPRRIHNKFLKKMI